MEIEELRVRCSIWGGKENIYCVPSKLLRYIISYLSTCQGAVEGLSGVKL